MKISQEIRDTAEEGKTNVKNLRNLYYAFKITDDQQELYFKPNSGARTKDFSVNFLPKQPNRIDFYWLQINT